MLFTDPFKSIRWVKTGPQIESRDFDGHRVDVRVPSVVGPNTPILVIHDGMNVFFSKYASSGDTWQVREAIETGRFTAEPLVIAVWGEGGAKKYNSRRINEFLCDDIVGEHPELWETLLPALTPPTREPRGNYFLTLVADEILPEVAKRHGLKLSPSRTALAGCSVAGVASIYWLAKRPDRFGTAMGLSSHWEFGGPTLVTELANLLGAAAGRKVWSDSGTLGLDAASVALNDTFGQALAAQGWTPNQDFIASTFWGTGHHETYWARRFEYPVNWWLNSLANTDEAHR